MRSPILLALAILMPAMPVLAQPPAADDVSARAPSSRVEALAVDAGPAVSVAPSLETQSVQGSGAVTQGAAIWVNPTDATRSQLLVGDNQNGLMLFNTDGGLRDRLLAGAVQGVDVQDDVLVKGVNQPLIMMANTTRGLVSYVMSTDAGTFQLSSAGLNDYGIGTFSANSVALFRSPTSNVLYAFAGSYVGTLGQFQVDTQVDGGLFTPVRTLNVGGAVVGLVVDDSQSVVYVAVQNNGIWQYGAEPDAGDAGLLVDGIDAGLVGPLGGLALYTGPDIQGYLLAVTGSDSAVRVYARDPANHTRVGTFTSAVTATIDAVDAPRVLAVSNRPLLPDFPLGMVALQDSSNPGGNENLKLLPWDRISTAFPSQLLLYTGTDNPDAGVDGGTNGDGGGGGGGTGVAPPVSIDNPSPPACSCSTASLPGTMLLVLAGVLLLRRRPQE